MAHIGGAEIRNTATVVRLVLRTPAGKPRAHLFFTYCRKDGEDAAARPITYSYNGGPGSASIWLHLGLMGPKRVQMATDGFQPAPPYALVANQLSLIVNRRVDRPNEVDIRILPKYEEPELIKVFNPALEPQYSTSMELGDQTSSETGSLCTAADHRIVDGTITRIATQPPGSVLLYNVFQHAGRSWSTGGEVVWQQLIGSHLAFIANANVYRRTIGAFSVVNRYPVPVTYTEPREQLMSGNVKLNTTLTLPRDWQLQLSSICLAPDLFAQGRLGSRYAPDAGAKMSVLREKGEIVVNATDLLNTNQAERTIRGTNFRLVSTDYFETQVIRVGYNWKF